MSQPLPEPTSTDALEQREWPRAWMGTFLEALSKMPNASAAARIAGINRAHAYDVRAHDEAFAAAWLEALDVAYDLAEQIAHRRATTGEVVKLTRRTTRTVEGKVVEETVVEEEHVQVSNSLLQFLLKSYRPKVYRERVDHTHAGPDGGPVELEVNRVPTRERVLELLRLGRELELPNGQRVPAVIEAPEPETR